MRLQSVALRGGVLLAFVALLAFLALRHEAWRDEADSWLMVRDASPAELFHLSGNAGTPMLWYFVQMPFAKLGLPYETQKVVHLAIAALAGGLFWLRAPFPAAIRLLPLFGYYLSFEYGVVARSYSLTALLLFSVAASRPVRAGRPFLYGTLVALLANTNAHGFLLASVLLAWEGALWLMGKQPAGAWKAGAAGGLGVAAAFWQLLPPRDAMIPQLLANLWNWGAAAAAFPSAFLPTFENRRGALALAVTIAVIVVASLLRRPRFLVLLLMSWGGLLYIFVFKFVAGLRHYGFFFLVLLFVLWLAEDEEAPMRKPGAAVPLSRTIGFAALAVSLVISCVAAGRAWALESRYAFSESREMAAYLRETGRDAAVIAGFPAAHTSAVLPYLRTRQLWYPGIEAFGSYMKWDRQYLAGMTIDAAEAARRFRQRFPRPGDALFLTNAPLAGPAGDGFRLLHRTEGVPFARSDEKFFLYELGEALPVDPEGGPFRASFDVAELPQAISPRRSFELGVSVRNDSDAAWPAWGLKDYLERVNLAYHWRRLGGDIVVYDGRRTALPGPLRPGETTRIIMRIDAPDEPGSYVLEVDLVWEGVAWFSTRGAPGPQLRAVVRGAS